MAAVIIFVLIPITTPFSVAGSCQVLQVTYLLEEQAVCAVLQDPGNLTILLNVLAIESDAYNNQITLHYFQAPCDISDLLA
jgi:hypothetical protein